VIVKQIFKRGGEGDCVKEGGGGEGKCERERALERLRCYSAGSKASLADVGLMVPSHERGFQKSSRALALSACSSNPVQEDLNSLGSSSSSFIAGSCVQGFRD
jgi:hypothetical protein